MMFGDRYLMNSMANKAMQPMQPIWSQQPNASFIQVYNRQSVEQFFVAPGAEALFMYEEEPVIARKRVDVAGVQVIEEYDLVPRTQKPKSEYVTREEFEQFARRFANESFDTARQAAPAGTAANDEGFAANAAAGNNAAGGAATDAAGAQLGADQSTGA